MANKQQTAITFLIEQIDKLEEEDGYLDIDKFFWLKQDALQMEPRADRASLYKRE
jgi:hypothetical protein